MLQDEMQDRRIEPTVELLHALATLNPIEREVWVDRHICERTLQAIADEFKLRNYEPEDDPPPAPRERWPSTRERIRQIEQEAARKVAVALRSNPDFLAKIEDPELRAKIERNPRPNLKADWLCAYGNCDELGEQTHITDEGIAVLYCPTHYIAAIVTFTKRETG